MLAQRPLPVQPHAPKLTYIQAVNMTLQVTDTRQFTEVSINIYMLFLSKTQ